MMRELTQDDCIKIRKDILKEFHKMCEEKNIRYSLGYGTLLGAVRHKGMIPWDDDIDVVVPRKDFEKLCELYSLNSCTDRYQFISHRNHPEIKTKIGYFIDFNTITETAKVKAEYHGVHIDVYPVDAVPNNKLDRILILTQRYCLMLIIRAKDIHPQVMHGVQKLIRQLVLFICSPINYDKALDRLQMISKKAENIPEHDKKTACIYVETGDPIYYPYAIFNEYTLYEYEGNRYWGIKDYDCVLKAWYGNYMTLPPEKERKRPEHRFVRYYFKDIAR